ncbi:cache domain-containing sensor histidine kinase [Paenibacillus sp. 1P07SE]|uniref:cache domain-containing sensor histidine kinase n=1 Tax=Paenibacillus sp. 1P07SE TaxID=3132209 RepID=UPI0039A67EF8
MMNDAGRAGFLSLRYKFILFFCLLITIPFLISGIVTYQKYSANVEQNAESYTSQIMDQIKLNLDRYIKEVDRLTLTPFYDENIMRILKRHDGLPGQPEYLTTDEASKMNLFISSLSFDRSEIRGMLIFANNGRLFSNLEPSVHALWEPESSGWMDTVLEKDGGLTILPPHEAAYYKLPERRVVSIARVIRDPFNHKKLGIVKVDMTAEGLRQMLSPVTLSANSQLYITDRQQRMIYATFDEEVTGSYESTLEETGTLSGDSYLSAEVISDYSGLKVVGLIPLHDLRKEARELSQFTLYISLLSLTIAYVLAVLSADRLVKPIRHLQSKMKLVQKGSLKQRAEVRTRDEIGQLTEVFNGMIEEIDHLVKQVYETSLREREAELSALQSQINPHFMYNTLETMNMLALQHQNDELSRMIANLGKLLRYTVDKQERPVYLLDEIRFVEAYLQIQSFRLSGKLRTEIHIDPSLELLLVPKLIVQPLIENAIEHGIGRTPQTTLQISAKVIGDSLCLIVRDDGIGIDEARRAALVQSMTRSVNDELSLHNVKRGFGQVSRGFAMRNVHQRLRLLYGESYGLTIEQTELPGTEIRIWLPMQWEE